MNRLEPGDPGYPALLAAVPARPALDVRGTLTADDALAVAIVGARRATPYGVAVAERLAADLAARGVTIVSGLARGIDTAAHPGAPAAGGAARAPRRPGGPPRRARGGRPDARRARLGHRRGLPVREPRARARDRAAGRPALAVRGRRGRGCPGTSRRGTGRSRGSPWASSWSRRPSAAGPSSRPASRAISAAKCSRFQAESPPRRAPGRTG